MDSGIDGSARPDLLKGDIIQETNQSFIAGCVQKLVEAKGFQIVVTPPINGLIKTELLCTTRLAFSPWVAKKASFTFGAG